jgi:hypothetical protein
MWCGTSSPPRTSRSQDEARQATGMAPLVGREHEMTVLLERWRLAREGNGQAVLLRRAGSG